MARLAANGAEPVRKLALEGVGVSRAEDAPLAVDEDLEALVVAKQDLELPGHVLGEIPRS